MVAKFLDRLDLRETAVIQIDINIATPLVTAHPTRIARLVLMAVEAFDNYPPGMPGRLLKLAARLPGGLWAAYQPLRIRAIRRLPPFGLLAKRPIPTDITDRWLHPLITQGYATRDLRKYARSAEATQIVQACERLRGFDQPALVVWAAEDHMMPADHGRRLADLLPRGELVEIADKPDTHPRRSTRYPRRRDPEVLERTANP